MTEEQRYQFDLWGYLHLPQYQGNESFPDEIKDRLSPKHSSWFRKRDTGTRRRL